MLEKEITLLPGERIDDLIRNDLKIIQNNVSFSFSIDAVLLANFATLKENDKVMDLGTGSGVIPLLLTSRKKNIMVTGLEIQEPVADMARRSILLNKLDARINIITGDIKEIANHFVAGSFDLIISNPPYMPAGAGLLNEEDAVAIAKHELKCTLEDVIKTASRLLNPKGRFAMVHRPSRLTDIIQLMRNYRLEPKRLRLVHSALGKKPSTVLVEAYRDGQPGLDIMEPLYIYNIDGTYTDELWRIYYGN